MKKIISLLLAAVLAVGICLPALAADEKPNYLVLGDSIAAGYGIVNDADAAYGRIVADTNGYNYINLARTATDSYELLEYLTENYGRYDQDGVFRRVRACIADADIISLSIGSNDYFDNEEWVKLMIGALFGVNRQKMDALARGFYENLCAIVDLIRSLNPDVTLLVQKTYCVWYGIAGNANRACANRCNAVIEQYAQNFPGRIEICDITPAMNYKPENLADDCVHPNARGNVAIARIVLGQLYDLGLGTETEPVVNVEGEDWNFFEDWFDDPVKARFITILVKFVTGNGVNILRKSSAVPEPEEITIILK